MLIMAVTFYGDIKKKKKKLNQFSINKTFMKLYYFEKH